MNSEVTLFTCLEGMSVDMGIKHRWLWMTAAAVVFLLGVTVWSTAGANGMKIVYVYSDSCEYCTTFAPTFEKVVNDYPQIMVDRLDIHKKNELDEALRLGAVATPTLFIVHEGQVLDKLEGDVPEKVLRSFLKENVEGPLSGNGGNS